MNKHEFEHEYKKLADLFVRKNNYIGNMNGWCGSQCCLEAKKSLKKAVDIDDEIRETLDSMFERIRCYLPDASDGSIITEALKDTKVKNDLSKVQKKDG